MELLVQRLFTRQAAQFGLLSFEGEEAQCFTLEDLSRVVKLPNETCVPAGRYELKLRTFGRLFETYRLRHPWNEPGMLWLQSVPQFTDVLIHCGSTDRDTSGCLLLGDGADVHRPSISNSLPAYERVYKRVTPALLGGQRCYINIRERFKGA